MRGLSIGGVLVAIALGFPAGVFAQGLEEVKRERVKVGFAGALAVPVGEFADFVDLGGGVNLSALFNFDRDGIFGVRFEGSFLAYGHERVTRPLSNTVQRILVDVTTNNWITSLGAGPQLTLGTGPIRPYLYGTVGFSYFATVSSVGGTADYYGFASTTNFDDVTFAASGGAGILVALSRGDKPVSLDLSVQSTRNGRTEYLRKGSIQERADGSLFILPIESEANLVSIKAGVVIGLGG